MSGSASARGPPCGPRSRPHPFHIGLAGLLDPTPLVDEHGQLRLEELQAAIEARLSRTPELRRRIRWTGFGQGRPAVVDDHDFAIARHVTGVDLHGVDEQAFWTWCANRALEPLGRDHPLWPITLATGLASGQVGVLVVLHHALASGLAGAALAQRLLDPAADTVAASQPWRPTSSPGPLELAIEAVATSVAAMVPRSGTCRGRRPSSASPAVTPQPRAPRLPSAPHDLLAPPDASRPGAGGHLPSLQQINQVGHARGATVNDLLLTAAAESLGRSWLVGMKPLRAESCGCGSRLARPAAPATPVDPHTHGAPAPTWRP